MNKVFEKMFAKQPDKIANGDYFYRIPWKEMEREKYGSRDWNESELEDFDRKSKATFMSNWEKRTFQGEFDETIHKIALEEIPFMDIASSEHMGLASYILKLNPKIPCLITDIEPHSMERLRSRIGENLTECDISIACFDNLDMPLKDASIDCVTSFGGISSSSTGKSVDTKIMSLDEFTDECNRKVLDEVYRILNPGGVFIAVESQVSWDYDTEKIAGYFGEHEKLFGMYTHERICEKLDEFVEWKEKYALNSEKITAAGFRIEAEKSHLEKIGIDETARYFSPTGDRVSISDSDRTEDIVNLYFESILYILRKPL